MTEDHAGKPSHLRLSGGVFTLSVLRLESLDPAQLESQLKTPENALRFLRNAPIVLDLLQLPDQPLPLRPWMDILRAAGCFPVGVRNASVAQEEAAAAMGLPHLRGRELEPARQETPGGAPASMAPNEVQEGGSTGPGQILRHPMRSGQRHYARNKDLVCLAAVNAGAEVLADGHLHVYAPLRGRALAGVMGEERSRIFCASLEAELVAIAGIYAMPDPDHPLWGKPAEIALQGEQLRIMPLGT